MDYSRLEEMGAYLDGTIDHVLGQVKDMFKPGEQTPGIIDSMKAFAAAVQWTEPWLIGLAVFHVSVFVCIFLSRAHTNTQLFIFVALLCMIWAAETLNGFLADNWGAFSTQNYFDKNGLFLSVVYSGPLMMATISVLVNSLVQTARMMVKVKRAELKSKARKAAKEAKKEK